MSTGSAASPPLTELAAVQLTPRQGDVLREVKRLLILRRYSPSLRELMLGLGLAGTNSISEQISRLCRKGVLQHDRFVSRSLVVTELGEAWLLANPAPVARSPDST